MHIKELLAGIVKEIKIKHKDGSETVLGEFKNLITNAGLDSLGTMPVNTSAFYCSVSSDSTAPTESDTSIVAKVGVTSSTLNDSYTNSGGTPSWFYEIERVYTFPLGGVVGNISKLYIHSATNGGVVFSSALIKDGAGNPTTISVTSEDQLFITWALRKNINTTPITGTISISVEGVPTDFNYEIKPANLGWTSNSYFFSARNGVGNISTTCFGYETNTLGADTGRPAGTTLQGSGVLASYSNGDYYRDVEYKASTSQLNFTTGLGALAFASMSSGVGDAGYQISFTPKLPKNSDKTLSLPFRISWGRA